MENKTIKQSMVEIKKEKLAIVLKELLHLKYILNYYRTKAPKDKPKRANKVDMSTANSTLQNVEDSLEKLKSHIDMLDKASTSSIDEIYFIILHSKIGYDLNNTLYIIELIYKKVYQIFEESYHQYIPKPTLGRRFSNNNLVGNLKRHYESIIKSLVGNEDAGLILSWSYRNYISLEEKHDRFASNNSNKYGAYINLPYWYYEIPTLLPSVAHACVRISLSYDSFKFKNKKRSLERAISRYIDTPRDDLSFALEEEILSDKYNLTNKILADLISYKIYGYAYVYSLFNDIIGAGLSKVFDLRAKHTLNMYASIKDYVENNFYWKAASYKFSGLRDISIIRLNVLLEYATKFRHQSVEYQEHIKHEKRIAQMQELLGSIISIKDEKSGLELIYENNPHYQSSFLILKRALLNISKLYKNEAGKINISNLENIEGIDFDKLWKKHFEENIHKNELRKLLHKETIAKIKSSVKDKEKQKEIGTPYSLVFIKMHKKLTCTEKREKICLDEIIDDCFKGKAHYHAFGIYDLAVIKDISEYPEKLDRTIDKKFNKINELNSGDKQRYYESRFSLMQIYPTIIGENREESSNVSIMYNIDLTTQNSSAGVALANSICNIAAEIENSKSSFRKVRIFKTLGPGDLIVLVDGVSNSDFLKLTETVLPLSFIKRTFTTVLAEKDKKELIVPQDEYRIVSFVRLDISKKSTLEMIIEDVLSKNIKEQIESINFTSGVLDLEIRWKAGTSVEKVMIFYNRLMEKSYVRDFQTKFNKNYPLAKE